VPDLPGFGATALPADAPDVLDVPSLVTLLSDLLDQLGIERAVLGGTAIGGYLALELAVRRPELAAGLVLIACKPAADDPRMAGAREALARRALDQGSTAIADELADQPFAPSTAAGPRAALRTMIEEADRRGIAGFVRGLAARPDPRPALEALRCPLLVMAGTEDPFVSPELAEELAARVPGATLELVEEAGHLPTLEQPAACASALRGFLRGIPA
jgi:pimeloyl-ACP methyl ester carboxylesterase